MQKMAAPGVKVSIGSVEDPLFGPVVSFGMAGPLTELLGDRSYRTPPLDQTDAAALVRGVKASPMLFGYRGTDAVDVEEIERLVQAVSRLQNDLPQVRSLELPLVLASARGAAVLDAVGRVEPVLDSRAGWFARRLDAPMADTLSG